MILDILMAMFLFASFVNAVDKDGEVFSGLVAIAATIALVIRITVNIYGPL